MVDEQSHPLHKLDKEIIDKLIVTEAPKNFDYINLARLINRYENFPGEENLKKDLNKILVFWNLSKETLFSKTRDIWSKNFKPNDTSKDLIGSGFDASN